MTDQQKKAFRTAYDFMESHIDVAYTEAYFQKMVDDLKVLREQCGFENLTYNLLNAVYLYLCHESEKKNDTERITERP